MNRTDSLCFPSFLCYWIFFWAIKILHSLSHCYLSFNKTQKTWDGWKDGQTNQRLIDRHTFWLMHQISMFPMFSKKMKRYAFFIFPVRVLCQCHFACSSSFPSWSLFFVVVCSHFGFVCNANLPLTRGFLFRLTLSLSLFHYNLHPHRPFSGYSLSGLNVTILANAN